MSKAEKAEQDAAVAAVLRDSSNRWKAQGALPGPRSGLPPVGPPMNVVVRPHAEGPARKGYKRDPMGRPLGEPVKPSANGKPLEGPARKVKAKPLQEMPLRPLGQR